MISTIRSSSVSFTGKSAAKSFVLVLALAMAGCTTVEHRPVQLPLPARPTVPAVKPAEVQCLAKDTYTKIVDRDRGYKNWGLELEAIIEANNAKAGKAKP